MSLQQFWKSCYWTYSVKIYILNDGTKACLLMGLALFSEDEAQV